jgi:uncharacterized protein (DUF302 family)
MADRDRGLVHHRASRTVDETLGHLLELLEARKITVFAVVDHSGEAFKAGLAMLPTRLVIFGNPRAGTPVMLAAPTSAIDLPLKILIWEDSAGAVWLTVNTAEYLAARHAIPPDLVATLAAADALAKAAAQ